MKSKSISKIQPFSSKSSNCSW